MLAYHLRNFRYSWNFGNLLYSTKSSENIEYLSKYLDITPVQAKYISAKNPVVKNLSSCDIEKFVDVNYKLGYKKEVFIENPLLFSTLPTTLENRYKVLQESGFQEVQPHHLASYLNIVKKRIAELKESQLLPQEINLENRLASCMTQWPSALTSHISGNPEEKSIYDIRLCILQKYLQLVVDLSDLEFQRGIQTYPTIKHRPLSNINESIRILLNEVKMPKSKIKSNLYLVHSVPDNLRQIIYKFKAIAGVDIREIIKSHPRIAMKNVQTLIEIRKILSEFGIAEQAQVRCFELYTLGPETIKERLIKASQIPEFNIFFQHPRFLKMIYSNKTAMKRLQTLTLMNKKCLSLNIMSGSSKKYKFFENSLEDRTGRSKDLIFLVSQCLENKYSQKDIRSRLKRHPFWINIPLVQIQYVHNKLKTKYSSKDMYENCTILLYPWNKVHTILKLLEKKHTGEYSYLKDQINNLNRSQILSLTLYLLEKNHYFSGNGVWTQEQYKQVQ